MIRVPEGKDLPSLVRELQNILKNLSINGNFNSFEWEGEIPTSSEVFISHPLGRVPAYRSIVRHKGGAVVDGDSEWTDKEVSLKNQSASEVAQVTVLFYSF
jgi:hypothetical protein